MRLDLEKIPIIAKQRIARAAMLNTRLDAALDYAADDIVLTMERLVLGLGGETFRVTYPRDWWQAFKERWAPRWALRRWPVDYKVVEKRVFQAVCPHLQTDHPGRHVSWFVHEMPFEDQHVYRNEGDGRERAWRERPYPEPV